jgi:hypothetical protein
MYEPFLLRPRGLQARSRRRAGQAISVLEAIRRAQNEYLNLPQPPGRNTRFFGLLLLGRLEMEQKGADPNALDGWVGQMAALWQFNDCLRMIDLVWACMLREASALSKPTVRRLQARRAILVAIVAARSTDGPLPVDYAVPATVSPAIAALKAPSMSR